MDKKFWTLLTIVIVLVLGVLSVFLINNRNKIDTCTAFRPGTFKDRVVSELNLQVCLTSDEPFFDVTTNTVSFKMVLVDKKNRGHLYEAVAGGKDKQGEDVKVAICETREEADSCSFINAFELVPKLNSKIAIIDIVYRGDDRNWGDGGINSEDMEFYEKLKSSVLTGDNFPNPRQGIKLHVDEIKIKVNE